MVKSGQMCFNECSCSLPPSLFFFLFWGSDSHYCRRRTLMGPDSHCDTSGKWQRKHTGAYTNRHTHPHTRHMAQAQEQVDIQWAELQYAVPFTSNPSMNLFDTVTHRNTYDSLTCCVCVCGCVSAPSVRIQLVFVFDSGRYSTDGDRITMTVWELHLHTNILSDFPK